MIQRKQEGFTLVEVLVAAALGLLLLGIVITVYIGSKSTFQAAEGIARSQEATRFALHFLKRDIRMSGFQECSSGISIRSNLDDTQASYLPSVDNAIFGWEFDGTDIGDNYTLDYQKVGSPFTQAALNAARAANSSAASDWTGNYIAGEPGTATMQNLPALIAGFDPLLGSDILAVSISSPLELSIQLQPNLRNPDLTVTDANGIAVASTISRGQILKVGDCSAIDTFQNTAAPTNTLVSLDSSLGNVSPGNNLNASFKWQKSWNADARLYQTTSKIYFVGTGSGGNPSLFVYETDCGLVAGCGAQQSELVEGVENMQIVYGEDTDDDGAPDVYASANNVTDFRDVVAVKLSLLIRSPEVGTEGSNNNPTHDLLDQITIDPPNDNYQRFINTTTVRIHNRGL